MVSLSEVHCCHVHLGQASCRFRTVAARTTWQCKSHPLSRSGPDVCRYLRSIQWLVEILCTYIASEIAGVIELYPFHGAFLKESFAWRYSTLCFSFHTATTMVRSLSNNKIREGWCVELLFGQSSCVFCGNQASPTRKFRTVRSIPRSPIF